MAARIILIAILLFTTLPVPEAFAEINWKVAPGRTAIKFKIKHFLLFNVKGKFKDYQGTVKAPNKNNFDGAIIEASVPIKSIYTGNQDRDAHLKKEEFFFAKKYPEMKFKSTSVRMISKEKYAVDGMITIRGITRPISFEVKHLKDRILANGKMCCTFKATGSLNRYNFGLKWNELTEAGAVVVDELVKIDMTVALIRST